MSRSLEEIEINNYKFQSLDGSRSLEEIERVQSFREIDKLKSQSLKENWNWKRSIAQRNWNWEINRSEKLINWNLNQSEKLITWKINHSEKLTSHFEHSIWIQLLKFNSLNLNSRIWILEFEFSILNSRLNKSWGETGVKFSGDVKKGSEKQNIPSYYWKKIKKVVQNRGLIH